MILFIITWIIIVSLLVFIVGGICMGVKDSSYMPVAFIMVCLAGMFVYVSTLVESNKATYSIPSNFKATMNKKDIVYTSDELGSKIFTDTKYLNPIIVDIKHVYNFYGYEISQEYRVVK